MRSLPAWLAAAAVAIVAAIVVALAWPRTLPVDVATVRRGRFEAVVEEDGRTRVRERYLVSAPVAGTVMRVDLEPGEEVSRGQILAVVVPAAPPLLDARSRREAEDRLGAAGDELRRAVEALAHSRTALAQEKIDLARAQKLAADGIVAHADLDKVELAVNLRSREVAAAEFEVRVSEHRLDLARTMLARLRDPSRDSGGGGEPWEIRSPVGGVVLRVLQKSESVVAAGAPLLEIADPGDLEVVVDLLTEDAARVAPGARVALERWGGETPLEGRVRQVEPSGFTKLSALGVEEQRVNVVLDIVSPRASWSNLGDGFRVDVRVLVAEADDALVAPTSALFRDGEGWAAWVVTDGRATRRAVQVARRGTRMAEIASGLAAGDEVIVYPGDAIAEGVQVAPRREEASPRG
ncbi:MAG: efflux RND transporter periplasmic adaptor subunit [Alphaproteobacteria bacterium]